MSDPGSDPSVVELTLDFAGLRISVRGPLDQAARFVQQVSDLRQDSAASASPVAVASSGLGGYSSPTARSAASGSVSSETRASILASFGPCPAHLLQRASRNLGGNRTTAELRATRAWIAGNWAHPVVDRRVSSPNRTPAIDLQNRYWAVVRCSNCEAPRIFTASAAYHQAVGPLEGSDSLSQTFPSETEARIYLEAAGVEVSHLN